MKTTQTQNKLKKPRKKKVYINSNVSAKTSLVYGRKLEKGLKLVVPVRAKKVKAYVWWRPTKRKIKAKKSIKALIKKRKKKKKMLKKSAGWRKRGKKKKEISPQRALWRFCRRSKRYIYVVSKTISSFSKTKIVGNKFYNVRIFANKFKVRPKIKKFIRAYYKLLPVLLDRGRRLTLKVDSFRYKRLLNRQLTFKSLLGLTHGQSDLQGELIDLHFLLLLKRRKLWFKTLARKFRRRRKKKINFICERVSILKKCFTKKLENI